MAKKVGQVDESTGRVKTWRERRTREVDWPVTMNDTRGKRLRRALWG